MELTNNVKIALAAVGGAVVVGIAALGYSAYQDQKDSEGVDPGWTLVSTADIGDLWYVNDASVSFESGRYAEAWVMNNQAKKDKDGTRSYKALTIFDCQTRQYRFMQFNSYAGTNGHGASVGTEGAAPTKNAPPGTNIGNIADYVCKPLYQQQSTDQPTRTEDLKQI